MSWGATAKGVVGTVAGVLLLGGLGVAGETIRHRTQISELDEDVAEHDRRLGKLEEPTLILQLAKAEAKLDALDDAIEQAKDNERAIRSLETEVSHVKGGVEEILRRLPRSGAARAPTAAGRPMIIAEEDDAPGVRPPPTPRPVSPGDDED